MRLLKFPLSLRIRLVVVVKGAIIDHKVIKTVDRLQAMVRLVRIMQAVHSLKLVAKRGQRLSLSAKRY
jgi:hypothetical protein